MPGASLVHRVSVVRGGEGRGAERPQGRPAGVFCFPHQGHQGRVSHYLSSSDSHQIRSCAFRCPQGPASQLWSLSSSGTCPHLFSIWVPQSRESGSTLDGPVLFPGTLCLPVPWGCPTLLSHLCQGLLLSPVPRATRLCSNPNSLCHLERGLGS